MGKNYFCIFLLLLLNFNIVAQDSIVCSMTIEETKSDENNYYQGGIPLTEIQPDSLNLIDINAKYFRFNILNFIIPVDSLQKKIPLQNVRIIIKNNDSYIFSFDENSNHNFDDDTTIVMFNNKIQVLNFDFLINNKETVTLKVEVVIKDYNGNIRVEVRPRFKLKIDSPIKTTIYTSDFRNCIVLYSNRYDLKKINPVYFSDEFIPTDTSWVVIEKIDFINKAAIFKFYPKTTKPIGKRVGYFTDLAKIKNFTNSDSEKIKRWKKSKNAYSLLHFWGPWCQPCRAEFNKVLELDKELVNSNIDFIHYAACFSEKEKENVAELIKKNEIPSQQAPFLFKELKNSEFVNHYFNAKSVIQLLDQGAYPNYYLISPDGQILYNGEYSQTLLNKIEEVIKK